MRTLMTINIEVNEATLKSLVAEHIKNILNANFDPDKVKILTKSKQNYKSEWEVAAFKAEYSGEI